MRRIARKFPPLPQGEPEVQRRSHDQHGNAPTDWPVTAAIPRGKGQINQRLQHNHQIECPKNQYAKRQRIGKEIPRRHRRHGARNRRRERHLVPSVQGVLHLCAAPARVGQSGSNLGAGLACGQRVAHENA